MIDRDNQSPEDRLVLLLEACADHVARLRRGSPDHQYSCGQLAGLATALSVYVGIPAYELAVAARDRAVRRRSTTEGNGHERVLRSAAELRRVHAA